MNHLKNPQTIIGINVTVLEKMGFESSQSNPGPHRSAEVLVRDWENVAGTHRQEWYAAQQQGQTLSKHAPRHKPISVMFSSKILVN